MKFQLAAHATGLSWGHMTGSSGVAPADAGVLFSRLVTATSPRCLSSKNKPGSNSNRVRCLDFRPENLHDIVLAMATFR